MSAVLAEVQQMDRATYIGSSDVAALMRVSKWRTPRRLSREDRADEENVADRDRARILRRGHQLEPFIVQMGINALRDAGHQVELVAQGQRSVHPDHPFIAAEIDAELIVDGERVNYGQECQPPQLRRMGRRGYRPDPDLLRRAGVAGPGRHRPARHVGRRRVRPR